MNNRKIQTAIRPKIHLAAATLSALVLLLALAACEPEPSGTSAEAPAATDTPLNLSLSGFDPHPSSGSDPNGDYELIPDGTMLSFDASLSPDGATTPQVDDTKPAYTYAGGNGPWYLWASVTPSRYNLSRADTSDIWYFENGPAPASPHNVAAWNKAIGAAASGGNPATPAPTAAEIAADSSKANVQSGAAAQTIPVTGINFTAAPSSIAINEQAQYTASVVPTDASYTGITWSSSDAGIVSVDQNGLVTGIAAGSAAITAASTDDPNIFKTESVVVVRQAVSGITLDQTSANVILSKTITLVATVNPPNASYPDITWSSSDTGVATVDQSGLVTGVAVGTAVITVTSVDDSTKTASATITVYEPIKIKEQPVAAYDETARKLTFSVTFDAAVRVTAPNNTGPQFAFTITRAGEAPKERTAAYKSGSGTATLVFEYAREDYGYGDVNYAADPIALNGGTIQDAQSRPAALGGITAQDAAANIAGIEISAGIAAGKPLPANIILTASSSLYSIYAPTEGRLNNSPRFWVGDTWDDKEPWWQANLGAKRSIAKIYVQGAEEASSNFSMKEFQIKYSDDGQNWREYRNRNGSLNTFGPRNHAEITTKTFSPPIEAQYLRVIAITFDNKNNGGPAGGRFEIDILK